MKASELIQQLQALIAEHGDLPVRYESDYYVYEVERVTPPQQEVDLAFWLE